MAILTGVAPVDDKGTTLFYEDSGKPSGADSYVTIVLCHGAILYGAFRPMFPYAEEYNIRLVAVTLRDYPRSTLYKSSELEALHSSDREAQAAVIRDKGLELSAFLTWFIHKENITPLETTEQGRVGGIAILGWSAGNCTTLALLGNGDSLSPDMRYLLGRYLRTSFMFDPPTAALSTPFPQELRLPQHDPSVKPEDKAQMFATYVTSYFAHSPSVLSAIETIDRQTLLDGLTLKALDDPAPSTSTIPAKELAEISHSSVYLGSYASMFKIDLTIYYDNLRSSLAASSDHWPTIRHVYIWCDKSIGDTIHAAWWFAHQKDELWPKEDGRVKLVRMEGVNHMPFWHEPKRTVELFANTI